MTGFIILVIMFLLGIWIYVELAKFPGKKARARGHPQADAISVLSWVGLLFGGVPWLIALVWAYTRPSGAAELSPTGSAAAAVAVEDETSADAAATS
jgi:hypothetical protein